MSRKYYEDRATIRDGAWAASHGAEGPTTTRRKPPQSTERRTRAVGEQARAVEYLESCRRGEQGEYAAYLLEEFMPRGINMYPPGDQASCASRIMGHVALYTTTGSGLGVYSKPMSREEGDKFINLLCGPK